MPRGANPKRIPTICSFCGGPGLHWHDSLVGARRRGNELFCSKSCVGKKAREESAAKTAERFWSKVNKRGLDECWEWSGRRCQGYGCFGLHGRDLRAHRFSYELNVGPIPDGLSILHSCDNRACVNPAHLRPGTNAENMQDCLKRGRNHFANKTHCKHGHPFTPENTKVMQVKGRGPYRVCRQCGRAKLARYQARLATSKSIGEESASKPLGRFGCKVVSRPVSEGVRAAEEQDTARLERAMGGLK